jgi:Flp pilus assembly protein TadD
VAQRYPDDATVQSECAEVEYRTERLANALQAADAALRINPQMVDPLVIKGMVAADLLRKAGSRDAAAWDAARGWFLTANHADPNAVMPLYEYYETFVSEGVSPPDGAVKALMRAQVLAPESSIVRAALARQMLLSGDGKSARSLLAPLAYSPHATDAKDVPLQVIKLIDSGNLQAATQLISDKTKDDAANAS